MRWGGGVCVCVCVCVRRVHFFVLFQFHLSFLCTDDTACMLSSSLPPPPYPPRLYSFANELEKLSIQREAVDLRETRETTEHEVLLGLVQQGPESFQAYHSQVHVFYDTPYFVYWLYCCTRTVV